MSDSYIVREGVGRTLIYGDSVDASKTNVNIVQDTGEKIPTAPDRVNTNRNYVLHVPSDSNVETTWTEAAPPASGSNVPDSPERESSLTRWVLNVPATANADPVTWQKEVVLSSSDVQTMINTAVNNAISNLSSFVRGSILYTRRGSSNHWAGDGITSLNILSSSDWNWDYWLMGIRAGDTLSATPQRVNSYIVVPSTIRSTTSPSNGDVKLAISTSFIALGRSGSTLYINPSGTVYSYGAFTFIYGFDFY